MATEPESAKKRKRKTPDTRHTPTVIHAQKLHCVQCNKRKGRSKFHKTQLNADAPVCKKCYGSQIKCTVCRFAKPKSAFTPDRAKSTKPACIDCVELHTQMETQHTLPPIDPKLTTEQISEFQKQITQASLPLKSEETKPETKTQTEIKADEANPTTDIDTAPKKLNPKWTHLFLDATFHWRVCILLSTNALTSVVQVLSADETQLKAIEITARKVRAMDEELIDERCMFYDEMLAAAANEKDSSQIPKADESDKSESESENKMPISFKKFIEDPESKKELDEYLKNEMKKYTFHDSDSESDSDSDHSHSDKYNRKKSKSANAANTTNVLLSEISQKQFITKFELKMPRNSLQYYIFAHKLHKWAQDNIDISDTRKWKTIAKTFSSRVNDQWNTYKDDKWDTHSDEIDETASDTDIDSIRKAYVSKLDNIAELKRFLVQKLNLTPHISHFTDLLALAKIGYNEEPHKAIQRIQRYIKQIDSTVDDFTSLNIHTKLRYIKQFERDELFERVLVIDNNKSEYNNAGLLNAKLKTKIAAKYSESPNITEKELIVFLRKISQEILPSSIANDQESENKWHISKAPTLVFSLKPIVNRKRTDDNAKIGKKTDGPSPKKRRFDPNIQCPKGNNCNSMIKNGHCDKAHKGKDVQQMMRRFRNSKKDQKHRRNDRNYDSGFDRHVRFDFNSRGRGRGRGYRGRGRGRGRGRYRDRRGYPNNYSNYDSNTKQSDCHKQRLCIPWQIGKCKYKHWNEDRYSCAECGVLGHPKYRCPTKSAQKWNQNPNRERYTPNTSMNHKQIQKHLLMDSGGGQQLEPMNLEQAQMLQMSLLEEKKRINTALDSTQVLVNIKKKNKHGP